ncbi:hypothetical protein B0J13DRAFT_611926 [Dactylonectria estremocensis]|uniref:NmrA-like domain-containing protein n=1 Tax=Dactylonectria estremocensis TaxID=1079267 RepID=A0A9P9IJV4_9HYPO|nr:hypothetical protein B0J13DRAFT_611926 [Dactylonectria estremocensis]
MPASENKIIAVVGGTGNISRSIVASLHNCQEFHIRVTSRDPSARKAKEFFYSGIEAVKADSWVPEELDAAFKDCWGVFINTNSDDPNFKNEITNGEVTILSFDNEEAISDYTKTAGFKTVTNADKTVWAVSDPRSFQDIVDAYNKVSDTKRARYVAAEGPLKAANKGKTKEVNSLFNYCRWVKGNYCGNKPLDLTDMKILKALGAKSRGRTGKDAELQTVEDFWAMTLPRRMDRALADTNSRLWCKSSRCRCRELAEPSAPIVSM